MKRFSDTEIWDKEWFMSLSPKLKCLVRFIFDKCDNAGIWSPNWMLASTYIGEPVSEADLKLCNGIFEKLPSGKIFIPKFTRFQYGDLSPASPPHKKVIELLKDNNLFDRVSNTLNSRVYNTLQEKEENKEKEKDVEMEEVEEKEKESESRKKSAKAIRMESAANHVAYLNEIAERKYKTDNPVYLKLIEGRLSEGATDDQCREVIEIKAAEWKGGEMDKHLTPSTLFAKDNFWKYVGQVDDAKARGLTAKEIRGNNGKQKFDKNDFAKQVADLYRNRAAGQ